MSVCGHHIGMHVHVRAYEHATSTLYEHIVRAYDMHIACTLHTYINNGQMLGMSTVPKALGSTRATGGLGP